MNHEDQTINDAQVVWNKLGFALGYTRARIESGLMYIKKSITRRFANKQSQSTEVSVNAPEDAMLMFMSSWQLTISKAGVAKNVARKIFQTPNLFICI